MVEHSSIVRKLPNGPPSSEQTIPPLNCCPVGSVLDGETDKLLEYQDMIKRPTFKDKWK